MACEATVTYECDEQNENCMKTETTPTPGMPDDPTEDTGPATDEEICQAGIDLNNDLFKEKCQEPTAISENKWDSSQKVCYTETTTTYYDGRDPAITFTTEVIDNQVCCDDSIGG